MGTVLACDLGSRRTGVALGDRRDGTVVALDTVVAASEDELVRALLDLVRAKRATTVLLGLPLLPGGDEGRQAGFVRRIGERLVSADVSVEFLDERYTTDSRETANGDAKAACTLLLTYLERRGLTKF